MMRSEQEVRRAIKHLEEASRSGIAKADPAVAMLLAVRDALRWVLGKESRFEREVMRPCDALDSEQPGTPS